MDCQDRRLTSIPPSQIWLKEPKHLLLARNRIKILKDRAFLGYESLTSLDLQQNQISLVEEGAFQGLTRLTTLLLQHNRLGTLSEEVLIPMPNLRYLRLHYNPWNCLCPLDSLIRTLQVPSNRNLGNHARWVILHKATHTLSHSVIHCSKTTSVQVITKPQNKTPLLKKSHLIYSWWLNCTSSTRCAEPIRLKGMKLKQVDPEFLCKESDPSSDPMGDQTDSTNTLEPSPIRSKPDAITSCHTYVFPQIRMDCSKQGKFTITFYTGPHMFSENQHVSYATERLGKYLKSILSENSYACVLLLYDWNNKSFISQRIFRARQKQQSPIWFGRTFLSNILLLASLTSDWFHVIVLCHLTSNLESSI